MRNIYSQRIIFRAKKRKFHKKRINSKYLYRTQPQKTVNSDNFLKNCLFGAIERTKPGDTTDTDKYIYSGYGLGFDNTSQFSHPQGGMAIYQT